MTCSRTGRVARAVVAVFALQLSAQCVSYEEGATVEIGLLPHAGPIDAAPAADGEPRELTTDLGYAVRIEQAAVSVTRVRIHPCAGASAPRPLLAPAVAYAHDPVPATFAEPRVVVDLMVGDAEPIAIATLRPPPGRYCGATVELGPGWGGGLSGETFAVRGTYVPPGGGAPEPFEIRSSAPLETGITFDAADGTPRVFRAEPGAPAPRVLVGLDYGRWLDGVDFRDPDAAARVEAVERSVLASIHGVM